MTNEDYSKVPPPHLLKKFSEQAREDSQKRGRPGYCKTFAKLCIDWALNSKSSPNNLQIGSSDITPPPELEKQWFAAWERGDNEELSFADFVIPRAAAWGADQELEACCALLDKFNDGFWCEELRAARRPKPPSLKEQALAQLDLMTQRAYACNFAGFQADAIRRALEALPDD